MQIVDALGDRTYCIADSRNAFTIPASMGFAEAASIPLALTTAWLALFSKDCLAIPRSEAHKTPLLVWGGSCKSLPPTPPSLTQHD